MSARKAMTYVKLTVAIIVALYATAFVLLNAQYTATLWVLPFIKAANMPTLLVIVMTAALTMILWWIGPQVLAVMKKKRRPKA